MAFRTPAALFLDENLPIHRDKRADGLKPKPLKPSAKPGLQQRKALRDVSNTGKHPVPNIAKGTALKERSTLKDKSVLRSRETTKNPAKTLVFADEETAQCHEWAKDGVECTHFTGNDAQKLDKDWQDKRVKKKVEKVMSALHVWSDMVFDPVVFPVKVDHYKHHSLESTTYKYLKNLKDANQLETAKFFEEVKELVLEPEILPDIKREISIPGDKPKLSEDSFTEEELDQFQLLENKPVEFQLREGAPNPELSVVN